VDIKIDRENDLLFFTEKNNNCFVENLDEPRNLFFHKIYWLNKLSGELPEASLIPDYLRPVLYSGKNRYITFELSDDLAKTIIQFTKRSYFSIYLVLLSALSILLQKYTGNNDVILGSPTYKHGNYVELNKKVVPLRVNLTNHLTFKDLLLQVKDTAIGAYSHQNYPFDELVRLLKLPQTQNRCPLFDVVVLLENIHSQKDALNLNNDVTLSFVVEEDTIRCRVDYNESIFKDKTINLIIKYYANLLYKIFKNINLKVSEINLLKEADKQQLLEKFNKNDKKYPVSQTIHELFEEQVSQTPDRIAVVCEGTQLTYRELNKKANQLARFLQDLGVRNGEFVGILKERDINFLIAILAILKVGGVYVPIDSTYPHERIRYMLSNSEVRVLLTDSSFLKSLTNLLEHCPQLKCLTCLDEKTNNVDIELVILPGIKIYEKLDFTRFSCENLGFINRGIDPAYMIYTSGSTGLPKGAIIKHGGAINHIYAQFDALEFTEEYSFLQSAPASSDISVWQFLAPLLIGGRTVIVDTETVGNPENLFKVIKEEKLAIAELVPVVLTGLLNYVSRLSTQERLLPDLRWMMVTGESVSVELVNQWLRLYPSIRVVNAYGPTEAADDITQSIIEKPLPENQRTVPIGKPLANLNLYILDSQMNLVPIGVPGEICVSGYGVGEGYWKNQEKTNLSFVPNPFPSTAKPLPGTLRDLIYKTGDLGRWLPDGSIEFLGRIDNQVKIRGFRIELGEIEGLLAQHSAVQESVVVVREDTPGDKCLVAYVVPKLETQGLHQDSANSSELVPQLRNFLSERLPQYMMPSAIVRLESLPIAPSGKVDRRSLPAPDMRQLRSEGSFVAPSTPVEEMLAGIWTEVLGLEKVGIHDNFFELGGHSLLATRVISQVRQVFEVELPLRRLFEEPTVAGLARDIERATSAGLGLEAPPIQRISTGRELTLSFAQQRLWFLSQLQPNNPFYNMAAAVRLQGQLNEHALLKSLNEILRRHEVLRTTFKTVEEQPVPVISSETKLLLPAIDLSELPSAQREAKVRELALTEAQQPFDLETDPMLRVKLLRLGEQEHVALFTMHHIASDGWSIDVLVRELSALYQAFSTSQPSPLPELPIQYADFAAWQRQWLQGEALEAQLSYWRQHLRGAPPVLELPIDHPRPPVQTFRGASYSFQLSQEECVALKTLSQQEGSTLFMTLLAAFKVLLYRYTGSEDIVVGSPIANRDRAEIEELIGFFVNTLVLRTDLSGNPTFQELLSRVREVALGAYAHQDLPFERLVEELQPQRSLSYNPLFQVMFVLQNAPKSEIELSGLTLSSFEIDRGTAMFDLTLYMEETDAGLIGTFEYNTDLFEAATITRMAGHLQTLLSGIVANCDRHLCEVPLLTEAEQQQLLVEWNETESEYPLDQGIHELFEAQAERTPDAVAVVFEGQQLTYGELNRKANQLAHYLIQRGVGLEVLVGICTERSLEMVIGLLGILKAGGAYVPLDPAYPQERLAFMLSDTQVPVLLTQQRLVERLPEHEAQVICLDSDCDSIAQESKQNPVSSSTADNLAYVIYTSGSTGKPKGVLGLHRGAVNRFQWMWETYPFTQQEVCCQKTSLNFVDSVWEIFGPLLQGVPTVIVSDRVLKDPQQFVETLASNNVTRLVLVPSLLRVLLDTYSNLQQRLPKLKLWVTSGEALSFDLLQNFRQIMPESILLNLYGSSEVSADVTCYSIKPQDKAPLHVAIGRPIANTQIYLLDRHLQPVPIGVPGELYVGGSGLARGYLNQPEMTQERFIPNPFIDFGLPILDFRLGDSSQNLESCENAQFSNPKSKIQNPKLSARLYKTGDLARYLPDGNIEFLGRIDNQVKLRGFRIELGEIEAVLSQHPGVREVVVLAREDEPNNKQLVAYVVAHPEEAIALNELQRLLKEKLPDYMVPSAFVMLEGLPLLPNGKVDLLSLPAPNLTRSNLEAAYQAPRTEIERTIATIWQEVLHVEEVGIHDNFFELGGHSLLLVQVHSKLQNIFQRIFPLVGMFQYPTISYLAEYLSQEQSEQLSVPQHSQRPESRTASIKRRKQAIQKHRAASKQKGVQS
jgi:amino acid adenylation domain-containing protein